MAKVFHNATKQTHYLETYTLLVVYGRQNQGFPNWRTINWHILGTDVGLESEKKIVGLDLDQRSRGY